MYTIVFNHAIDIFSIDLDLFLDHAPFLDHSIFCDHALFVDHAPWQLSICRIGTGPWLYLYRFFFL